MFYAHKKLKEHRRLRCHSEAGWCCRKDSQDQKKGPNDVGHRPALLHARPCRRRVHGHFRVKRLAATDPPATDARRRSHRRRPRRPRVRRRRQEHGPHLRHACPHQSRRHAAHESRLAALPRLLSRLHHANYLRGRLCPALWRSAIMTTVFNNKIGVSHLDAKEGITWAFIWVCVLLSLFLGNVWILNSGDHEILRGSYILGLFRSGPLDKELRHRCEGHFP